MGLIHFLPHEAERSVRVLLLACILTQGCGSLQAVRQVELADDFDFAGAPGTGVIVGSVVSVPDDRYRPVVFEPSAYFYESVDAPALRGVLRSGVGSGMGRWDAESCSAGIPADRPALAEKRSIPEAACGRLFAVALPAGRYRFHTVQVREPVASTIERAESFSHSLQGYEWTVIAGQVLYLGELRSRACDRNHAVRGGVRDEFRRDWPLLRADYPALRAHIAIAAIIDAPVWLWIRPGLPQGVWPETCLPHQAE